MRTATLGSIGVVGPVEFKTSTGRGVVTEAGPLREKEVRDLILKADLAHTWRSRRSAETGRPLLSLHVCTYFQYLSGFGPAQTHDDASTDREFHLDFDRHWTTTAVR